MKLEKLNDDKIRITLNSDDLKENDIDFHTFMSNPIESQELFFNVLDRAERELGFVTEDYKIMVEALAMSNGNFILTVTRMEPEKGKSTYRKKKINIKRKSTISNNKKAIYSFNSFDEFCSFCNFLNNNVLKNLNNFVGSISLYEYNKKYYLVFTDLHMNDNLLKSFCSSITEFASFVEHADLFETKLLEYGTLIMKDNAIDITLSHFC